APLLSCAAATDLPSTPSFPTRRSSDLVGLQLPQLVEVGAVAVGDHAAVDHACRGLDVQRFLQEADTSAGQREIGSQLVKQARMRYRGDQLRQQLQALAQPGELAGPHAAQR